MERRNPFFRLVILAGAVFVMTILALVTDALFGRHETPVSHFLTRYGGMLLLGETGVLVVVGLLAMAVDRWQTLRQTRAQRGVQAAPSADSAD